MMAQINSGGVLLQYAIAPTDAICISKDGILNQQTILTSLKVQFSFPDYFGENLDAAFDLLLDVIDTLTEPTVWRFRTGNNVKTDSAALVRWQELMQDLIHYALGKGLILKVELFIES